MFHYERGLFLTKSRLAIDVTRHRTHAFVSHAHADHMARHGLALCTPATARLYCHRLGQRRTLEMPYHDPLEWHGQQLTTLPAGHCLGSAMLFVSDGHTSLLYTGDFKLDESATAGAAELRPAETLVMECTFGRPQFQLPPREEVLGQFVQQVRQALDRDQIPIVCAYALGKAQEITRALTDAEIAVQLHPEAYAISEIYQECGVALGPFERLQEPIDTSAAIVAPPRQAKSIRIPRNRLPISFAVTGWSHDSTKPPPWGCDVAVPLSDHADFSQLLEAIERVAPQRIFCLHGPAEFAELLVRRGHQAEHLPAR